MRATIRDTQALVGVSPQWLAGYLRASGWRQDRLREGVSATWILSADSGDYEVLQPLDPALLGYASRVSEALGVLELVEGRSQIDLYRDIVTCTGDLLRVPLVGTTTADGSIALTEGASALDHLRALVEAGACAAVAPRASYTRKPDQVGTYMEEVRLGQTEHGSFVFTVVSPLPPAFQLGLPGQEAESDRPFQRRALESLAFAVDALRIAANTALASDSAAPFEQAVAKGVSANLCQAVAGLGAINGSRGVELRFSWSRLLNPLATTPATVRLSEETVVAAHYAAGALRERAPREAVEVQGLVTKCAREAGHSRGTVVVKAIVDDRWRSVQVDLDEQSYNSAVDAHKARAPVSLVGDLTKEGGTFSLANPRDFRSLDDA